MITKLRKIDNGFEIIDRNTIQEITNSAALAIWVYLQSKPEDWSVSEKEILSHFDFGRDRYLSAMRYLRDIGLYEYITKRDDIGRITGRVFVLYPVVRKASSTETPPIGKTDPLNNTDLLNNTEYRGKPTQEQVVEMAKKLNIPEETAIDFYLWYEGKGWRSVNDFVPLLRKWDRDNNRREKISSTEEKLWA